MTRWDYGRCEIASKLKKVMVIPKKIPGFLCCEYNSALFFHATVIKHQCSHCQLLSQILQSVKLFFHCLLPIVVDSLTDCIGLQKWNSTYVLVTELNNDLTCLPIVLVARPFMSFRIFLSTGSVLFQFSIYYVTAPCDRQNFRSLTIFWKFRSKVTWPSNMCSRSTSPVKIIRSVRKQGPRGGKKWHDDKRSVYNVTKLRNRKPMR